MEDKKFVKTWELESGRYQIMSDIGFLPLKALHKTIEYYTYTIETEFGNNLKCADNHIVKCDNEQKFVKE